MDDTDRAEKLQALAVEAEKQAIRCADPEVRDKWLTIAARYREIAQRSLAGQVAGGPSDQVPRPPSAQTPPVRDTSD